jgi:hypothetical protein
LDELIVDRLNGTRGRRIEVVLPIGDADQNPLAQVLVGVIVNACFCSAWIIVARHIIVALCGEVIQTKRKKGRTQKRVEVFHKENLRVWMQR